MKISIATVVLYAFFAVVRGDVHSCVHGNWYFNIFAFSGMMGFCFSASRKLAKTGKGDTVKSCMQCDPTHPYCAPGCQKLVTAVYWECDGVCIPDGYYFDPSELYCAFGVLFWS
jgi:hypothetical protein